MNVKDLLVKFLFQTSVDPIYNNEYTPEDIASYSKEQDLDSIKSIIEILRKVSAIHLKGDYESGEPLIKDALQQSREINNPVLISACLRQLGNINFLRFPPKNGLQYYEKALEHDKGAKYKLGRACDLYRIAFFYVVMGEIIGSGRRLKKAKKLLKKHTDSEVYRHVTDLFQDISTYADYVMLFHQQGHQRRMSGAGGHFG